ncbi:MAG: hypothetical protein L0Y72_07125 [Gemmataceae bacterium]|nr:hypothetical protein [Gemmataceae bacterium]MCI0738798.1 hypothetical protein [Gemmataceae bacterium]
MSTLAPNRPRSRWPKRLLWTAVILLLVLGGPLFYFNHQRRAASRELQDAIDEVDRVDPEWRLEQLESKRRTVPDGKNAVFVIIEAHQALSRNWKRDSFEQEFIETPPPCRLTPDLEKQLRQELTGLSAALEKAHKLVDRPTGCFRIVYSRDWINTTLPHLTKANDIAGMLEWHICLCLHEKQRANALLSLRALVNAARAFGDEPMIMSQITRMGIHGMAVACLERTLAHGLVREDKLVELQISLMDEAAENLFAFGMRGERAGIHFFLTNVESGEVSFADRQPAQRKFSDSVQGFFSANMLKHSHAWLITNMTRLVEADKDKGCAKYAALEQLDSDARNALSVEDNNLGVAQVLYARFVQVAKKEQRTDTLLYCAMAGIAAERFRLKEKRWPHSLQELVEAKLLKEVPEDLMDGQPLRFRRAKDGIVIYSVGLNKDYQGDALDNLANARDERIHIEFRLWDMERRHQPPLPPRPKPKDEPDPDNND